MMRMFDPASASLMPCIRSCALLRVELADEQHDRAAVGKRLANELPGLASRPPRCRCRCSRSRADCGASLSCVNTSARFAAASISAVWFCGSTGEIAIAVDALGEQVVDDALLLGGGAVGGDPELRFDVGQLGVGLLDAAPRDRPEVGGVVGHERQLERLRASAAVPERSRAALTASAASNGTDDQTRRMSISSAVDLTILIQLLTPVTT